MLSKIIKPIRNCLNEDLKTEVQSTEELLSAVAECNGGDISGLPQRTNPVRGCKIPPMQSQEVVVDSMDIVALFPSCKMSGTTSRLKILLYNSESVIGLGGIGLGRCLWQRPYVY